MFRLRLPLLALALSAMPLAASADEVTGEQILACEADRAGAGCAEVLTRVFVCERANAMAGCAELLASREAAMAAAAEPEPESEPAPEPTVEPRAEGTVSTPEPIANSCPVIDSRGWEAVLRTSGAAPLLVVSGAVTLPTPGYAVAFEAGMSDRSARPVQTFTLAATPPAGMVAQVLMVYDLRAEMPAMAPVDGAAPYSAVRVVCDGETLAEIAEIRLAD